MFYWVKIARSLRYKVSLWDSNVHHCGPQQISTIILWIAIKFCTDVHVHLRMSCYNSGDAIFIYHWFKFLVSNASKYLQNKWHQAQRYFVFSAYVQMLAW